VRSLLGAFAQNLGVFHQKDGSCYTFYADKVLELDEINPQVAARMVGVFNQWKSFNKDAADLMVQELKRIESKENLSKDVREIVSKALKY
jgi:aminopeptidase N